MRAIKMLVIALALQVVASASAQQLVGITNSLWRYSIDGTDQGTAWRDAGFDDSLWPESRALFGNDPGYPYPFIVQFNGTGGTPPGPQTAYYRTRFNWVGATAGVVLTTTNYVDDAFVLYLNGTEILRNNISTDPVLFATGADGAAAEGVAVVRAITLDTNVVNPLMAGGNVVAVEVHQTAVASSDHVFGMSIRASQIVAPCTDNMQPTNRTIAQGRSTTFTVVEQCAIPAATITWFRNVGAGEEQIVDPITLNPITGATYTLSNAVPADSGSYYARLTNLGGSVDSRPAVLIVEPDMAPPRLLSARVVGPGLSTFRLTTDEELCGQPDPAAPGFCGGDFTSGFFWKVLQSDDLSVDLGVVSVAKIDATTYELTTDPLFPRDPTKQYRITVNIDFGEGISDLYQNFIPAVEPAPYAETGLQVTFQQGDANGYAGTQDAAIHSAAAGADVPDPANPIINTDGADGGGVRQALLRFDNIFGSSAAQIPLGAVIGTATLTLNQTDNGTPVNLHRMLVNWDPNTATWNLLSGGLTADDAEAAVAIDAVTPGINGVVGPIEIDVTASLRAWAAGGANLGWALIPTGTDGWRWNSSESGVATAPLLSVEYARVACTTAPTFSGPPPTPAVNEGGTLAINVGGVLSGDCGDPVTYQWTRNGTDIGDQTSRNLSIPNARPSAHNGAYRLRVTNPNGTATSDPVTVTVTPDTAGPIVTRVASSADGTTITVAFNEAVVQALGNYTLTPSGSVTAAVPGANNAVTLTTTPRSVGTAYSLRIAGVTDTAETPNSLNPNPTVVALTSASVVPGAEFGGIWSYNSNNLDGVAWTMDPLDASWGSGPAAFGLETSTAVIGAAPTPIMTPLTANSVAPGDQLTTTYFRKDITLPALPAGARYVICHYTDDGHITYLDGVEINRFAMPAGAVTFTNRSTGIPNGGEASMRSFTFSATPGAHVLAVELHQAGNTTSSDVWFDMEVRIVGGSSPSLSISRNTSPAGSLSLNWNADANWRLRSSATVNGQYNNVGIPAGTAQGSFLIPAATAGTGNNFYLLDFDCQK